jgi:polyhydroxybutyrate depolymerase
MKTRPRLALAIAVAAAAIASATFARRTRPLDGTTRRQLVVGGVTRSYLLHAGGAARPGRALVLVLHGWRGGAADIERRTRGTFDRLADTDGAVVAYPEALGDPRWNDGWVGIPGIAPIDDVGFLAALIDAVAAEHGIDRKRVFAAGLSNGAGMVHRLACERPDLVAAVAPVSGGMAPVIARACAHTQGPPVSIIAMHGTADPIVPFDQSIRGGVATWVKRNGCPETPVTSALPDADPADGTRTRVDVFAQCAAGTAVELYTIEGGGHAWPGGTSPLGFIRKGPTPRDFDAAVVIWDFFHKHPRP